MVFGDVVAWIIGLIAFIVVLALSIGLHELGHYGVARAFKLSVPRFFIGFGPTLFKKETKNTNWGVKAIPLGGFVQIEDGNATKSEDYLKLEEKVDEVKDEIAAYKNQLKSRDHVLTAEEKSKLKFEMKEAQKRLSSLNKDYMPLYEAHIHEKSLLSRVHPFKRILIFLAGPVVNLVLGSLIIFAVLMGYPSAHVSTKVDTVNSCATLQKGEKCGAAQGGMLSGDKIVSIDGKNIENADEISASLQGKNSVDVIVNRNDYEMPLTLPVEDGTIGIMLDTYERPLTFVESSQTIGNVFFANVEAISKIPDKVPGIVANIFGAEKEKDAPSSIVAVGKTYGDTSASDKITTDSKIQMLLTYSGLLNLGLGLINLIFLLPLDGGKILIALMDWIKMGFSKTTRKEYNPVGVNSIKYMTAVMIVPVLGFMGLIILSDVLNIGRGLM